MSLRWIYGHMIEEYARHIGHADLLRERIDGATGARTRAQSPTMCARPVVWSQPPTWPTKPGWSLLTDHCT